MRGRRPHHLETASTSGAVFIGLAGTAVAGCADSVAVATLGSTGLLQETTSGSDSRRADNEREKVFMIVWLRKMAGTIPGGGGVATQPISG